MLVATENNTLYSFDLESGKEVWHVHLAEPMSGADLPCGDIATSGITGTPVADPTRGLVYAVTFTPPGRHNLVAVDLATGAVRFRAPIDPSGADPLAHQQRAALALAGGQVYVAYGGLFGDCGDYHGWVVAADAASGAIRATYQVPTQREGGIWAPPGPSIDGAGNLYVATGNGSSDSSANFDYGDAVLKLSPSLRLLDWFAPTDWAQLSQDDADVGSMSPALLDGNVLFQIGKAGVGYLVRTDHLGHVGGQVYQAQVCSAAFGGTAYQSPMLYVPCTDGLVALRVSPTTFTVGWRAPGFFAGPPIVAGGAVWTIGRDGTLYALDPTNGNVRARVRLGSVNHFVTPAASGANLVVPAARQVIVEKLE